MYTECREGSLGNQPLPEGSGSKGIEALGQWGAPLSFHPSQTHPLMGVQRERSRGFRWILGQVSRGLGEGALLQSSVIPLALSSSCTLVR